MITIKKIKPLGTAVVTTKERYGADELVGTVIDPKKAQGSLKEFQKVIAVSDYITKIKVGDLVKINPDRYAVKKFQENSVKNDIMENTIVGYNFPQVEIDGQEYLFLQDRDIDFVVEEYEEVAPQTDIIHTEPHIIIP